MTPEPQPTGERERRLDVIRETSDRLTELARSYERLRYMAEKDCTPAFLALAEAAGRMAEDSLSQLATLLEILFSAQMKSEGPTQ